jgi:phosphoribosyl-AMP cyclohydrolase
VLMMAFMNAEAVERTQQTGKVHYYSRSRRQLWMKGESSGHVQTVREIRFDCDADCLLLSVEQAGAACHTGHRSCFYRFGMSRACAARKNWSTRLPSMAAPTCLMPSTTSSRSVARIRRRNLRRLAVRQGPRQDPRQDRRGGDRSSRGRQGGGPGRGGL